jgi:hypothetical protein
MNEHFSPGLKEADLKLKSKEVKQPLSVDKVYRAEEIGQDMSPDELKMVLYSPQREIAVAKHGSLEQTSLTLENPLRISYREYITQWNPTSEPGPGFSGMRGKIRDAMEAGHDGIVVEADPQHVKAKAGGYIDKDVEYTFATDTYFKFEKPGTAQKN